MSEADKDPASVVPPSEARFVEIRGHRVGKLVGWSQEGPLVNYPGNPHGHLAARTVLLLDAEALRQSPGEERAVLLVFEEERSDRPIITGMLTPTPKPPKPEDVSASGPETPARTEQVEAIVDGRRVELDGRDEIVLRCGRASITLRRNGRVVIRGTYVETCAEGVNRVKGGSVVIN